MRKATISEPHRDKIVRFLEITFYILAGVWIIWFLKTYLLASMASHLRIGSLIGWLVFCFLVFLLLHHEGKFPKRLSFFLDSLVVIFVIILIFRNDFTYFDYSNFLGTANDIMRGKDILVNTVSIYGFLDIYFLAVIFKLFNVSDLYTGFSLVNSTFSVAGYLSIYFFLRHYTKKVVLSILALFVIVVINFYYLVEPTSWYPNASFFRLGMVWPVFFLVYGGMTKKGKLGDWILAFWLAFSFLWVAEVSLWIWLAFIGTAVSQYIFCQEYPKRTRLLKIIPKTALIFLLMVLVLTFRIWVKYHTWPVWTDIVYFLQYSARGAGMDQIKSLYLWPILTLMNFLMIYVCFLGMNKIKHVEAWLFLSFFGVLCMLYYAAQAIIEKLAAVALPTMVLFFVFIGYLLRKDFTCSIHSFKCPMKYAVYSVLILTCSFAGFFYNSLHRDSIVKRLRENPKIFLQNTKTTSLEKILPKQILKEFQYDIAVIQKLIPENESLVLISKNDTLYYIFSKRKSFFKVPFYPNSSLASLDLYRMIHEVLTNRNPFLFIDNSDYQCYGNAVSPHGVEMRGLLSDAFEKKTTLGLLELYVRRGHL